MAMFASKAIENRIIRAMSRAVAWPIQSLIEHVRSEMKRRIDERCGDLSPTVEAAE